MMSTTYLFSASLASHSCTYSLYSPIKDCFFFISTVLKKITTAIFFCFIFLATSFAQDSSSIPTSNISTKTNIPNADSLAIGLQGKLISVQSPNYLAPEEIKRRVRIVAAANIIGYSAAMIGLYNAWYKDYPQSKFHVYNDFKEWKQMDKMGHMYSAYIESKISMEMWRWTGIDRKKQIWLGGMSGAAYQTVIEILDGFSTEWGWSWGDFAANIAGSSLLVAQELAWNEQRIQLKWSFHRKTYSDPSLNMRSDDLFGKSNPERYLKDYNGQTYWLSVAPKSFFPKSKFPAWLQLSIGTGAEGMFGGYENMATDDNGNVIFNRTDIERRRQWFLAPDIDFTKIKTHKKGIKVALQILNIFKFPTPSLEYSSGKFSWNWLHF